MTIKRLIEIFQTVATAHINVNTFTHGEKWEYAVDGREIYVAVHLVEPFIITQPSKEGIFQYQFQMMVLDKSEPAESEEVELYDKCISVSEDILEYIRENYKRELSIQPATYTTVTEYSDNMNVGVLCDLVVSGKSTLNRCDLNDKFIIPN